MYHLLMSDTKCWDFKRRYNKVINNFLFLSLIRERGIYIIKAHCSGSLTATYKKLQGRIPYLYVIESLLPD